MHANAIMNATSGKHMPTEGQTDNYHWGGKTVYYRELGRDENAKDKTCLLP
jgi:hypothetical protein